MTEADGLSIVMLVGILLSFGIVVTLIFSIVRNASKSDVEGLSDDVDDEKK